MQAAELMSDLRMRIHEDEGGGEGSSGLMSHTQAGRLSSGIG